MRSLRWLDRRVGYVFGSLAILLGVMTPAAFPVFASAASLQNRSIVMTSSAPGQAGVSYKLTMDISSNIDSADGGVVVQFCDSDSTPIVGTDCTAPTGLDTSSVTTTGSTTAGTATPINSNSGIQWVPTSDVTGAPKTISMTFNDITNPSTTDGVTFYARITTYTNNLSAYTSPSSVGSYADSGGIALATASQIGITAYVQETLAFCVSSAVPNTNCGSTADPSLKLGETIPGSTQKALDTGHVSTGVDYAQLTTNASHGVTVNLNSNAANCGGLIRVGDGTNCDIGPQNVGANTISSGQALFGLEVGASAAAPDATTNASGSTAPSGSYSGSKYFLDYNSSNPGTAGITSPYGSALFGSTGPIQNENTPITFGASVSALTPAGIYGAQLGMIATSTF